MGDEGMPESRLLLRMSMRERYHRATATPEWVPKLKQCAVGRSLSRAIGASDPEQVLAVAAPDRRSPMGVRAALHALGGRGEGVVPKEKHHEIPRTGPDCCDCGRWTVDLPSTRCSAAPPGPTPSIQANRHRHLRWTEQPCASRRVRSGVP